MRKFALILAALGAAISAQANAQAFVNGLVTNGLGGYGGTPTFTLGAAVGTGATVACAGGATCDNLSGTIVITTGTTGETSGTVVTVNFSSPRVNRPNCVFNSNFGLVGGNNNPGVNSASMLTSTTPTASATYVITYFCGGY